MEFNNKFDFEWANTGVKPSANLQASGFEGGYKPPASVFNYFWNKTINSINELQQTVSNLDNNKVDKVSGKQLSTNDYTTAEKNKLAGIVEGANKTTVVNNLTSTSTTSALSAAQGKSLNDKITDLTNSMGDLGAGDMLKSVYDSNGNGVVDNAENLGGQPASYFTNVIESVSVNGTNVSVSEKTANIELPIEDLSGESVTIIGSDTSLYDVLGTVTAGEGATVLNDLRDRAYTQTTDSSTHAVVYTPTSGNIARGKYSLAAGSLSTADGDYSTATGYNSYARGNGSVAIGYNAQALSNGSVAFGYNSAIHMYSFAAGYTSNANGEYGVVLGNHLEGGNRQMVIGRYNKVYAGLPNWDTQSSEYTLFTIGNGTTTTRANAFRITADGQCRGTKTFLGSGADFARFYEWLDGNPDNEDRRGLFVVLDGEKIRIATADDDLEDVEGIISANPAFIENAPDMWQGMYKKDIFGAWLTEDVEIPETINEETGEVEPAHTVTRYVVNPEYDPDQEYKTRDLRKEWAIVGFSGFIVAIDDGTCEVNGHCKVGENGKATKSTERTNYRCIARLDDTHIKIRIK